MSVKDNLITFIKGFILGVANIIPGVSGGTLAVTLGLYETILSCVNNFFKDIKKNITTLLPIGLGIFVALISTSKLVTFALANYKAPTIFLFVGLIIGGTTLLTDKVKGKHSVSNIIVFIVTFLIVIALNFLNIKSLNTSLDNINLMSIIVLLLVGFIASSAMIIPGISGSFILMILGFYEKIIATLSNLTNLKELSNNLIILVPFGIGVLMGILFMARLITTLIEKDEAKTYHAIIGFVLSSVIVLILQIGKFTFTFGNIIFCIFTFFWGFFLSKAIEKE